MRRLAIFAVRTEDQLRTWLGIWLLYTAGWSELLKWNIVRVEQWNSGTLAQGGKEKRFLYQQSVKWLPYNAAL